MVPGVVAPLDGQSSGCALNGNYTSAHYNRAEQFHLGAHFFLGWNPWCVQLSNDNMFSVADCTNVCTVCVCGGKVCLNSIISSAVHIPETLCASMVSCHGHEFVCTCRYVHFMCEHACECAELCWPLCCGLKRQLLFSACLCCSSVTSRRCFVFGSFRDLKRDTLRWKTWFKMIIHSYYYLYITDDTVYRESCAKVLLQCEKML